MDAKNFYELSVSLLTELSNLEDSFFKSRAYRFAVKSIKDYVNSTSINDFYELEDYTILSGIGYGICGKLIELKTTGKIDKLSELRKSQIEYLDTELYKIRKGYITKRIPYDLAIEYFNKLKVFDDSMQYAGSLRRKKTLIGDIDILVDSDRYRSLIVKLIESNLDIISSGDYKTSIMIDKINNVQVDIISCTKNNYPTQLLYLTGSQEFNIKLRARAKSMGYKLNQYGLFKLENGSEIAVEIQSEEDIFSILNLPYTKPEDR